MINWVNDALIDSRNTVNKKRAPENEKSDEAIGIGEKNHDFNKQ